MSGPRTARRFDSEQRDTALWRLRRTTRWVAAGAVAATAVVIGVAAHDDPGHSAGAATQVGGSTPQGGASNSTGGSIAPAPVGPPSGGSGVTAPAVSPAPSTGAPQARTGQS